MYFFYFVKHLAILTGNGLMIGSVSHEHNFINMKSDELVGLDFKDKKVYNPDDDSLVTIIREGDIYLIKFLNEKFLYMNMTDHDLTLKKLTFNSENSLDTDFGFKFDFVPIEQGFLITGRGQCLEINKNLNRSLTISGKICDPKNNQQWFYILKVDTIGSEKKELDKEGLLHQDELQQHEGPIINKNLHDANSKRDPYMYGNEPY